MINFGEEVQPATPTAGRVAMFASSVDHNLYIIDSNGVVMSISNVIAAAQSQAMVNLFYTGF